MINHHPDDNLLIEYASGTLDTAQAIAVKTHLHFCVTCQHAVKQLETIGGIMLEALPQEPVNIGSFDSLMAKIEARDDSIQYQPKRTDSVHSGLPRVVEHLTNHQPLKWRKVNRKLKSACLPVGQKGYEVALQQICAGGKAPTHDHGGIEMTVVLKGSFSDDQGLYQQGDFVLKQPGDTHQPVASRNEDCLCLSVQNAPVKLTGVLGRLANPFIRLQSS